MKLYAYLLMAYLSLKESLTYWKDYLSFVIFSVFRLVLQLSAWYALYSSVDFAPVMGRSYETMITYYLVVQIVGDVTSANGIARALEQRMSSGEIATDMLRPAAPRGILIARSWGEKFYFFIPTMVIFAGAALVVGGIQLPASPGVFAAFVLSLCLGYLINLTFELVMATFAFWFVEVNTLRWFVSFFTALSGTAVPLWLLPPWLQAICRALPFQAAAYVPMQIYLGGTNSAEILSAFGTQVLWIIGLFLLQEWLWQRGKRRIVVLGG